MDIKFKKGISLLELLLVMSLGAVILVMAVRYFQLSSRNSKVEMAVKTVQSMSHVSYEWLQAQRQENFSSSPNGSAISLQALIDAGLIQNTARDTLDPWGGAISVGPGTNASYVKISLAGLPQVVCRNLKQQLNSVTRSGSPVAPCNKATDNVYFGEF